MAFNIFQKHYNYLGLHLNSHALKCLQFEKTRSASKIHGYVKALTPKGLILNDTFGDHEALAEFIKKAVSRPQFGSINTDRVVVSIPESKSFIRVISMAAMDEAQAENAIMFEAEAYIPLPMDQVYFDWQIIGRKDNNTMDVLLIASPKEYVDAYMGILEKAGLKLCAIEVEAQSVSRALIPHDNKDVILIADIDATKTALIMVEEGIVQFTSSVPIAGNVFTERLAKALNVTPAEAEKVKYKIGIANTTEYPNLKTYLLSSVQDLSSEIKNILKFHYDHSQHHVSQLLLTGGGAKLQHLDELLAPTLEEYAPLTITVANPFQHIPHFKSDLLTPYEALSFTTAIGLAIRELS